MMMLSNKYYSLIVFGCLSALAFSQLAEDIWQTIWNGHDLQGQKLRTVQITNIGQWSFYSAQRYGFNPNQVIQLAYDVFTNRFGAGYFDMNGNQCALFDAQVKCDRYRILANKYEGAFGEFECLTRAEINEIKYRHMEIAYGGVAAVGNKDEPMIGNAGNICAGGEKCARFVYTPDRFVELKGESALNGTQICYIVRRLDM